MTYAHQNFVSDYCKLFLPNIYFFILYIYFFYHVSFLTSTKKKKSPFLLFGYLNKAWWMHADFIISQLA